MSADNYMHILERDGGYVVDMRFASCNYTDADDTGVRGRWFPTFKEADDYAHSEWTEYGVRYGFEIERKVRK